MPDEFRGDYTPTSDIFGKFIEGLKFGRSLQKDKEEMEVKRVEQQLKTEAANRTARMQNLAIPARTGGFWRDTDDLERGMANLAANQPRAMADVLPAQMPATESATITPRPDMVPFMQAQEQHPTAESVVVDPAQLGAKYAPLTPTTRITPGAQVMPETPKTGYARPYASESEIQQYINDVGAVEALANPTVQMGVDPNTGATVQTYLNPSGTQQVRSIGKPTSGGTGSAQGALTKAGIEFAALLYSKTGQMPSLGMGSGSARLAIVNRAAEMSKGGDGAVRVDTLIANAVQNAAAKSSYTQLRKQADNIMTFERKAQKDAQRALFNSEKVYRLGVPVFNKALLAVKNRALGDKDIPPFALDVRTFINEYARITTSVTGGGVVSDSARQEIESLLREGMTHDQFKAVINEALIEMNNRVEAYNEHFELMKGRMNELNARPTPGGSVQVTDTWDDFDPDKDYTKVD